MSKPRVLLADDHTLVLEGFKKLLEEHTHVVGSVEDGRSLLDAAKRLRPDIVVLDISMPKLNGLDAARRLRKILPETRLIFVTVHADQDYVNQAFKAGASAYLLKRSAGSELSQAIKAVRNGNYYVTSLIAKDLVRSAISETEPEYRRPGPFAGATARNLAAGGRRTDSQRNCFYPGSVSEDRRVS